ncbi:MAG: hypothetical protein WCK15_12315 [Pirellula sp.]
MRHNHSQMRLQVLHNRNLLLELHNRKMVLLLELHNRRKVLELEHMLELVHCKS